VILTLNPELQSTLQAVVEELASKEIASRISSKDDSIWGPAAQPEASIRLGWVDSFKEAVNLIPEIVNLRDSLRAQGVDRIVLCGMGGSSLAPEVITKNSGVELVVLDSTAPDQVAAAIVDLERTAVVVSSKSGSTVETDSQKRAFEQAFTAAGIDVTQRIIIVTDPGSPLDAAARQTGYRVFNADPNVGGRYSALTAFGLVPSGLAGADIAALVGSAVQAAPTFSFNSTDNPALWLGAVFARTPGSHGFRDKFLIETDYLPGFGDWAEQLVAESTGKDDRGILPVVVSSKAPELTLSLGDTVTIRFGDAGSIPQHVSFSGELGELFLLWEHATAVAGYLMGINPFDQPNVESAKVAARELLDSPAMASDVDFVDRSVAVKAYGFEVLGSTVEAAIEQLMAEVNALTYFSIQVYLNRAEYPQFEALRDVLAARTGRPVTFGWGPRFLHSTGQYHKGGPKQALVIQITGEFGHDLEVPGRPFSFGTLINAQALGDANVLSENGLKVVSLRLSEPLSGVELLTKVIAS
jgi:glucose-6-phosphate isomerase